MRWAVTANLMVAWIVTIPASALIAGIFAAKGLMALTHARAARVLRPET